MFLLPINWAYEDETFQILRQQNNINVLNFIFLLFDFTLSKTFYSCSKNCNSEHLVKHFGKLMIYIYLQTAVLIISENLVTVKPWLNNKIYDCHTAITQVLTPMYVAGIYSDSSKHIFLIFIHFFISHQSSSQRKSKQHCVRKWIILSLLFIIVPTFLFILM
jgi:hypothetical protein